MRAMPCLSVVAYRSNAARYAPGFNFTGDEDCLYLSIYAPQNTTDLPVLLWIRAYPIDHLPWLSALIPPQTAVAMAWGKGMRISRLSSIPITTAL